MAPIPTGPARGVERAEAARQSGGFCERHLAWGVCPSSRPASAAHLSGSVLALTETGFALYVATTSNESTDFMPLELSWPDPHRLDEGSVLAMAGFLLGSGYADASRHREWQKALPRLKQRKRFSNGPGKLWLSAS